MGGGEKGGPGKVFLNFLMYSFILDGEQFSSLLLSTIFCSHIISSLQVDIPWSSCLACVLITGASLVLEFYAEAIATQRSDHHLASRVGSLALLISSLALSIGCWTWYPPACEHPLSAGLVIAVVLLVAATVQLTQRSHPQARSLVGYSASGLPLYSSLETTPTVVHWASSVVHKILENPDSRRIFYFLILNLVGRGRRRGEGLES